MCSLFSYLIFFDAPVYYNFDTRQQLLAQILQIKRIKEILFSMSLANIVYNSYFLHSPQDALCEIQLLCKHSVGQVIKER